MSTRGPLPCVLTAIALTAACSQPVTALGDELVRPAQFAGSWYPGDAGALARQVDDLMAGKEPPKLPGKPIAVISPHAGYRYSAPVAADAYRCLKGHRYKRVIVLALSHRQASRYWGVDVPRELTAYATPLGDVPIDRVVCDDLLKHRLFTSNPEVGRNEHSLELQLPFLQRVLGDFQLVPLLVGRMETADYADAAGAILPWLDDETLLVASSDFTHFGPNYGYQPFSDDVPNRIRALGDRAAAPILRCDFDGFVEHLDETRDTICGRGPISLLLRVLSMKGGAVAQRMGFDTSGAIARDWNNSVTYQSFVFTSRPGTLAEPLRKELLTLARQTVTAYLNGKDTPDVDAKKLDPMLRADGACFVTLENHGRLRGCIGNMKAQGPLYEAVIRNAVSACQDQRFVSNPVTADELDQLDIEISYLTPLKRVDNIKDIIIGQHGLWILRGFRRGVLLPQVAYERGWTREEFLSQTCRKAGLPLDAWKDPTSEIYSFEAEVFGEKE